MAADMRRQKAIERLGDMIGDIRIGMLTTVAPDGALRSRPMVTAKRQFDGDLWFFTARDAGKVDEIGQSPHVNVSYASAHADRYASISGTASLVRDARKIEVLWKPEYAKYFSADLDLSDLGLLKVSVDRAEYWDASASRMVKVADQLKALFAGERPRSAEHGEVEWSPAASQR